MKSPGIRIIEKDNSRIATGVPTQTTMAFVGKFDRGPAYTPVLVNQSQLRQVFKTKVTGQRPLDGATYIAASKYLQLVNQALIIRVIGNNASNGEVSIKGWAGYSDQSVQQSDIFNMFKINTLGDGSYVNYSSTTHSGYKIVIDSVRNDVARTGTGTLFNVVVYLDGQIVQTFTDCGLIQQQQNFVAKVIGDAYTTIEQGQITQHGLYGNSSRHIYVQLTQSFPYKDPYVSIQTQTTYGITGGSDGDVITDDDYVTAVNLLGNADLYDIQAIVVPQKFANLKGQSDGLGGGGVLPNHKKIFDKAIQVCATRGGDCMVLANACDMQTQYNSPSLKTLKNDYNSSHMALYYNYIMIRYDNVNIYVPPTVLIPKVFAFNDAVKFKWFAAAGHNRGRIQQAISVKYRLNKAKRDVLYADCHINPIAYFANDGVAVYGQKTSQIHPSATSSVNVRRLCIYIIKQFTIYFRRVLFQNNTVQTRNLLSQQLTKFMQAVKDNQGVYNYQIVLDDSLNTPQMIDRLTLVGQLYIQPARAIQFIKFTLNIDPTSASIAEITQ